MRGPGRNASPGAPYFVVLASGPWHAPGNKDVSQARRPEVSHGPVRTGSCVGWLCDCALPRDWDRARGGSRHGKCVASLRTSAASLDHTCGAPSPLVSPEAVFPWRRAPAGWAGAKALDSLHGCAKVLRGLPTVTPGWLRAHRSMRAGSSRWRLSLQTHSLRNFSRLQ